MALYHVTWEIDLEADNPREAAQTALSWLQEKGCECVIFGVKEHESTAEEEFVNLLETDDDHS